MGTRITPGTTGNSFDDDGVDDDDDDDDEDERSETAFVCAADGGKGWMSTVDVDDEDRDGIDDDGE